MEPKWWSNFRQKARLSRWTTHSSSSIDLWGLTGRLLRWCHCLWRLMPWNLLRDHGHCAISTSDKKNRTSLLGCECGYVFWIREDLFSEMNKDGQATQD